MADQGQYNKQVYRYVQYVVQLLSIAYAVYSESLIYVNFQRYCCFQCIAQER